MKAPRIVKILAVEPFQITALWTNGEVRINVFVGKLEQFKQSDRYRQLADFEEFSRVEVGAGDTLTWPHLQFKNSKGQQSAIALDPDVLLAESTVTEPPTPIEIDPTHEFTQADYARRKGLSPSKVRTWVKRGKLKSRYVPHLDLTLVVE